MVKFHRSRFCNTTVVRHPHPLVLQSTIRCATGHARQHWHLHVWEKCDVEGSVATYRTQESWDAPVSNFPRAEVRVWPPKATVAPKPNGAPAKRTACLYATPRLTWSR